VGPVALDYARFLRAQDPVWSSVIAELTLGRKQTHWMWFVFPQLRGLGTSEASIFFGLSNADDAADYMAHPLLSERMTAVCALLESHAGTAPEHIFGSVDATKLRSSMTLFQTTPQLSVHATNVLQVFFAGQRCDMTLQLLGASEILLSDQ
jgi:uncharacterized protein (DUF1810 family)